MSAYLIATHRICSLASHTYLFYRSRRIAVVSLPRFLVTPMPSPETGAVGVVPNDCCNYIRYLPGKGNAVKAGVNLRPNLDLGRPRDPRQSAGSPSQAADGALEAARRCPQGARAAHGAHTWLTSLYARPQGNAGGQSWARSGVQRNKPRAKGCLRWGHKAEGQERKEQSKRWARMLVRRSSIYHALRVLQEDGPRELHTLKQYRIWYVKPPRRAAREYRRGRRGSRFGAHRRCCLRHRCCTAVGHVSLDVSEPCNGDRTQATWYAYIVIASVAAGVSG